MTTMISTPTAPAPAPTAVVPVLPETAPFTAAQRAWLNGFFAGLFSRGAAQSVTEQPRIEEQESMPWHDAALSMDERLQLAEGKPQSRKLMAAMAQLDCGACGYVCQTYAEAIANGEEKDLTRCAPGGRETAKKLKELVALVPAGQITVRGKLSSGTAKPQAAGRNAPVPA